MNWLDFSFIGLPLRALASGALWWPEEGLLCVSDLHLGKSERIARRTGYALPPYETQDTLARLHADVTSCDARSVICLGDSFDDLISAQYLTDQDRLSIQGLQAGRHWIWIEGNHDPGPVAFGGEHLAELAVGPLIFRHIAQDRAQGEISGHYHPKARIPTRGRFISRPAFLVDDTRLILPAYGTYTGGSRCDDAPLRDLMQPGALAILTGAVPTCIPMPR